VKTAGIDPGEAMARAIAFAIDHPHDVEIGDITIRPTVQGWSPHAVFDRVVGGGSHR
jgi:hypothetical protein